MLAQPACGCLTTDAAPQARHNHTSNLSRERKLGTQGQQSHEAPLHTRVRVGHPVPSTKIRPGRSIDFRNLSFCRLFLVYLLIDLHRRCDNAAITQIARCLCAVALSISDNGLITGGRSPRHGYQINLRPVIFDPRIGFCRACSALCGWLRRRLANGTHP